MSDREERFEQMLRHVQDSYDETVQKLERLRADGRTKTVTYRELVGNKLMYQNMLDMYRSFGLI